MAAPLWYRALGAARYLAYGLAVLAIHKLGAIPGLPLAALLILLAETLWRAARARVEGAASDERDEAIRQRASTATLTALLLLAGLAATAALLLRELGLLHLTSYQQGILDGYIAAAMTAAALYAAFSTLYHRRLGG